MPDLVFGIVVEADAEITHAEPTEQDNSEGAEPETEEER